MSDLGSLVRGIVQEDWLRRDLAFAVDSATVKRDARDRIAHAPLTPRLGGMAVRTVETPEGLRVTIEAELGDAVVVQSAVLPVTAQVKDARRTFVNALKSLLNDLKKRLVAEAKQQANADMDAEIDATMDAAGWTYG